MFGMRPSQLSRIVLHQQGENPLFSFRNNNVRSWRSSSSSSLHPSWKSRVAMVDEALNMLKRFETQPSALAGSGHQWIADEGATKSVEWRRTKEAVSSLDVGIRESPLNEDFGDLLAKVVEPAARLSTDDTAPGYMAYVPSGGLFHSAVADFLGSALNRYVTIHEAAPALAAIENECIDWACRELVGWDNSSQCGVQSGGVLTSGGSFANLVAIHAARQSTIDSEQLPKATLYVSEQAHYCIEQAGRFIGLQPKHIRRVPSNVKNLKMDTDALRQIVEQDIADGLIPIAICPTAGTTNTGSCDDVQACANICAENGGIWLHVDAAYGGAFSLTSKGRETVGPLKLADSVVVDPHKGLFMPYGLGALLLRNVNKLMGANHMDGACMQPRQLDTTNTVADIMNLSPELTRDFRGLRMWLPLKMVGTATFRKELEEKLELTTKAAQAIEESNVPGLRVVVQPELSIFTFKLDAPEGVALSGEELDRLNIDFLDEIHKKANVLLSPFRSITDTPGEFSIRMAILSHRTDQTTVDTAVEDIIDAAKIVRSRMATAAPDKSVKTLPDRSSSIKSAAKDPVADYRELAALLIWNDILGSIDQGRNFRILDVCSGTGRWMQAFSDIVLKEQQSNAFAYEMDFVDLCQESLAVLDQRRTNLLARRKIGPGEIHFADACDLPPDQVSAYDLVTNMHGLYGFTGISASDHEERPGSSVLQTALKRMIKSLKPEGTLVLAIAHRDSEEQPSFYDRVGREFADMGITKEPYICAEDVIDAFASLGIECNISKLPTSHKLPHDTNYSCTLQTLEYREDIAAVDKEALHCFVLEESGANSFPATFNAGDGSIGEHQVSSHLLDLAKNENYDKGKDSYSFQQRIGVFVFRNSAHSPDTIL